jgi:ribosomal protein L11 methyltransferase
MDETPKQWFATDVDCAPAAAEAVESAFNQLDTLGTEIDSLHRSPGERLRVTGYFETPRADADVWAAVVESLRVCGFSDDAARLAGSRLVEETDWLAEWKKHWKPTRIGRFVIAPPWEKLEDNGRMVIWIEPNMAFGTGTHETTQLCLEAIDKLFRPGQSALDVGTGTGILAIAAAKLGGESIFACDTDAGSVAIARENSVLNGVGDLIDFRKGPIDERTPSFDFVCANLTIDVILPILDLLLAKTRSVLVLSGILADQEGVIADDLTRRGISNFDIGRAGQWISIVVRADQVS